jgi:hypothetical protein
MRIDARQRVREALADLVEPLERGGSARAAHARRRL